MGRGGAGGYRLARLLTVIDVEIESRDGAVKGNIFFYGVGRWLWGIVNLGGLYSW